MPVSPTASIHLRQCLRPRVCTSLPVCPTASMCICRCLQLPIGSNSMASIVIMSSNPCLQSPVCPCVSRSPNASMSICSRLNPSVAVSICQCLQASCLFIRRYVNLPMSRIAGMSICPYLTNLADVWIARWKDCSVEEWLGGRVAR